jgi:hypothetical protein
VVSAKNSNLKEEVVSEERSIFFSVVTPLQPSLNFSSTSTKLHQEVFTLQERVLLPSVSLFILRKIQKLKKLFWRVELLCSPIEVYVALTSSTRWTITPGTSCMKLWNSRLFLLQKPVSSVHLMPAQLF